MKISVKNKTLLFITFLLIGFATLISVMIYIQQEKKLLSVEKEYFNNVQFLYTKVLKKYETFYTDRILENINREGLREAFANKNRKKVYELLIDQWNILKQENQDMYAMQFVLADGTVFLRMNNPQKYGDNIENLRGMIQKINHEKKVIYGFDTCSGELVYRIMQPIFYKQKYIGVLELGIKPNYILNEMHYYHKIEGALVVQKCPNLKLDQNINKLKIGKYFLQYDVLNNENILKYLPKDYNFESFINIYLPNGDIKSIYSFDIKDFKNSVIAKALFFKDITKDVHEFNSNMIALVLFLILAILIMLIVVNIGFNITIRNLENNYIDVNNYKNMIDDNVIVSATDLNGKVVKVSNLLCKVCGYTKKELIGKKYDVLRHPDMTQEFFDKLWSDLKKNNSWSGEVKNRKKNGETFWVALNIQPKYKDGALIGYDRIMHDITDKKINEELLIIDALTHVHNRRHFNDIFPRMINSVKREGGYLNFLILDIDHFKQYNDTYGHQTGDEALVAVAKVLEDSLRRGNDYCFRLGGEEFGILYKSLDKKEARAFAELFKNAIISLDIKHENNDGNGIITASFGLVSLSQYELTDDKEMYAIADEYLYKAKKNGRNRVESNI